MSERRKARIALVPIAGAAILLVPLVGPLAAADLTAVPLKAPEIPEAYDWTGFYAGGHAGYAWGNSDFSGPPGIGGSISLAQPLDHFDEAGSWFVGVQGGYNFVLPNRMVLGAEVDETAPSFPALNGLSIGGTTRFGPETYSETVLASGTVRGRIGYAPGDWLFYATGGFAWTYNQLTLTNTNTNTTDTPFLWRLGWAAGAGVEVPVAPHWTARLEYLHTGYGDSSVPFANNGQQFVSNFSLNEVRAGLNYQFGNDPLATIAKAPDVQGSDILNFHGEGTFVWQGYPAFHAPYTGAQSLTPTGQGAETVDAILAVGVRLWQGAEFWVDPEYDQGFGLGNTHGVAGFTSGAAYKLGFSYPYARFNRYFIRQTIDLGGDTLKVDADFNQFAQSETQDRIVLTVGKFYMIDIFDTNKYANNPRADFLNWSIINNGAYDFGSDAWSTTYGAAAEWYQGNWTWRAGIFDMAYTPADVGGNSALGYGLDPSFNNFELLGEIEYRYKLWDQPGKIKLTGFLIRGRMGNYDEGIALSDATGLDVSDAVAEVRAYQSRPGLLLNLEQQVTETVGLFGRAGWADGNVEAWNNTDIDRTVEAGFSFDGKLWNRSGDTIGIGAALNGIASPHIAFFNAGGLGIVIGDGQLPHPGLEQVIEAYYSYAISPSTKVSFDYQYIGNPAYNTDRGPVNVFAGRFHWQF